MGITHNNNRSWQLFGGKRLSAPLPPPRRYAREISKLCSTWTKGGKKYSWLGKLLRGVVKTQTLFSGSWTQFAAILIQNLLQCPHCNNEHLCGILTIDFQWRENNFCHWPSFWYGASWDIIWTKRARFMRRMACTQAARDTKLERANFFEISSFWLILARFG